MQLCCFVFFYLKIGSTVSQIQDVLLEYEQMIKREKKGYRTVCRELRKLESEKESLQLIVNETQDLAQLEMKWKNDIQSLKYVTWHSDKVLMCQCPCSRRC